MKTFLINCALLGATILFYSCNKEENENAGPLTTDGGSTEVAYPGAKGTLRKGSIDGQAANYEEINGEAIFQGDIVLTEEQLAAGSRIEGTGRSSFSRRWPTHIVYYTIDPTLTNQARVTDAIAHWQTNTGVRFQLRTTQANYVTFRPGSGCSSSVGMVGGQQFVTLGTGCTTGNTIHEIGHAIGLWHEHTRADRGNSVIINWANIEAGKSHNFETYIAQGQDGFDHLTLDFGSVMMYASNAFSSNGNPTITRLDGTTFTVQRNGLSTRDRACVNVMYPKLFAIQSSGLFATDHLMGTWRTLGTGNWTGSNGIAQISNTIYVVQGAGLYKANKTTGAWSKVGTADWTGTTAMTSYNGSLYIIQGTGLYRANPNDGSRVKVGTANWSGATAMISANGWLYVIQGAGLYRANPNDGTWIKLGTGDWTGTKTLTQVSGTLYMVQGSGLYKTNASTGASTKLGTGNWTGTTALTNLDGKLYVVQGTSLYSASTVDGSWTKLGTGNWSGTKLLLGI